MNRLSAHAATDPRLRAGGIWVLITLGTLLLAVAAVPEAATLLHTPGVTFARLLVQCCSVVALLAAAMLWLAMSDVAWSVLRSPERAVRRPRGPVRSALLAACGLAVIATAASASASTDSSDRPPAAETLSGLPLPDRAEGSAPRHPVDGRAQGGTVRVAPGDSLWSIAAEQLGPGATPAEIAVRWRRVHALNIDAIGDDPDVIAPGLVLDLPQR